MTAIAALILAGGRGRRMGGIAKPLLRLDGATLLSRTLDAARAAGCTQITVAGPRSAAAADVAWAQEDPPFGGPVAGLAAALVDVTADWVLVLPADLVDPSTAARALATAPHGADGHYLVDEDGREQWLTGLYRTAALRERVAASPGGVRGVSTRALLDGLELGRVSAGADGAADVDTWEHLRKARRRVGDETEHVMADPSRTLPPEALDAWAAALRERFGLSDVDLPVGLILDLARDVANAVARPAAPFSAYAAGLVAGRAGGSPEQIREAVDEITRLAAEWENR